MVANPSDASLSRKPLRSISGYDEFEEAIADDELLSAEVGEALAWAKGLEREGLVDPRSYTGESTVLILTIPGDKAGLASLYVAPDGGFSVQLQRTVFVRRAPGALADIESAVGAAVGSGTKHAWSAALRDALERAYRQMEPPNAWQPGEWYVNFGHDAPRRDWADARRFGYISAGSGDRYSGPLKKLQTGEHVFVYVPKNNGGGGYVGYGEVLGAAMPADRATLEVDGRRVPYFELVPHAEPWNRQQGQDNQDWIVPVRWSGTRDVSAPVADRDFFANQNTVAQLTHRYTRDRVLAELGGTHSADEPGV